VLWLVLIGRHALVDPAHTCACVGGNDPGLFMWALDWWPHAITAGVDPFWTSSIWFPSEIDLPATTSVPALSLVLWPLNAVAGVVVTYNFATLLAAVLSAWLAYRLCRYVTGAWLPSLVGGYVFGFSSYELGQTLGHLHLIPIFLVPAAVQLVLERLDGRIPTRRFVILLALVFALQVLISTEMLFAGLAFGLTALLLAFWLVAARRDAIRAAVGPIFAAGGLAVLVLSPFLYAAFRGLGPQPSLDWPALARVFSADPLNYVVPTPITWIGGAWAEPAAAKFNSSNGGLGGNYSESGAYIGLPLLALTGWYLARTWHRSFSRFALALLALVFIASLGAQLHVLEPPLIAGREYHEDLWLPWAAFAYLPVFDHLLPVRFAMFAFLIVGVLVARALTLPLRRHAWAPWLVAGAGVAALLPAFGGAYWSGKVTATPFFEDGTYKRLLAPGEVVLSFPMQSGESMVWQAESDWYFRLANGYIAAEVPPQFWNDPVAKNLLNDSGVGPVQPANLPLATRDFLDRHRVDAVIVEPQTAPFWVGAMDQLLLPKQEIGGVVLYRVDHPFPYIAWGPEQITVSFTPEGSVRWLVDRDADVTIVNPKPTPQTVILRGLIRGSPAFPGFHVRVSYPDETAQELQINPAGTFVQRRVTLPPGTSTLGMIAGGPKYFLPGNPTAHYLELRDFRLSPR